MRQPQGCRTNSLRRQSTAGVDNYVEKAVEKYVSGPTYKAIQQSATKLSTHIPAERFRQISIDRLSRAAYTLFPSRTTNDAPLPAYVRQKVPVMIPDIPMAC